MKQNKNCYVDVMKWAHEHKCRAVSDYIMMACFDGATDNLDNRLSVDETEKLIRDIIENDPDYQNEIATADIAAAADARDISEDIVCGVCIDTMCMVSNGNTYPCAGWQSYVCGNIKQTPLREIWENSPQVKHLRSIRKKHFPMCINCPDKNFCAMCMVRNGNEDPNGDYMKINEHFCKVAALNRKVVEDWKAGI
jgi:MoaA/NifB/PqqE/SkfB family radical SAM enzyme